jgi:hypothetical protein
MKTPQTDQPRPAAQAPHVMTTRPAQPATTERQGTTPTHDEGHTVEEPGYGHGV